ncbi:MAG: hypothetical protein IJS32_04200 [Kiritimatiellae bacterium]|nr:hypothetical protein [Kiritimatiellia bacterium]
MKLPAFSKRSALLPAFAAFFAAHAAGALWYARETNPDYAVCVAMARDMALGRAWPVFFCGQAYMGSLEPAVGAMGMRLAGSLSTAALNLSLLFFAAWLAVASIRFARAASGGRASGVRTLLLLAVGPAAFFHYLASTRGGYMLAMALSMELLLLPLATGRRGVFRVRDAALYGLWTGLAVWNFWLALPAAAAAGVALLARHGRRLFAPAILLSGAAAALAGAAPFLLWNVRHGWASFGTATATGSARDVLAGGWLLWKRLPQLCATGAGVWPGALLLAALAVLAAWGLVRAAKPDLPMFGKKQSILPNIGKTLSGPPGILLLYGAFFAAVYAASDFHHAETVRYLLPLFPILAAALDAAVPALPRPARFAANALVLAAAALFAADLPAHAAKAERNRVWFARSAEAADALRERGASCAFANYVLLAMGVANGNVLVDCPVPERFPDVARALEESVSQPAVLEDFNGFSHFLRASCATAVREKRGWRMHTAIARRAAREEALPRAATGEAEVSRENGRTAWTWRLSEKRAIAGIRIWPENPDPHPRWELQVRDGDGGAWRTVSGPWNDAGFSFSGERLYFGGVRHRFEMLLPSPVPAEEVRLAMDDGETAVRRIQLLAPAEEATGPRPNYGALARFLAKRGLTTVYADRDAANGLGARTSREPSLYPESLLADPIRWDGTTALVARLEDAPGLRDDLTAAGVPFAEERFAGHAVFRPSAAPATPLRFLGPALAP